jgi:hypothetical protein
MNIHLVDLPDGLLQPGDEIAVFDGLVCVGGYKIRNQQSEILSRHTSAPLSVPDGSPQSAIFNLSIPVTAMDGLGDTGFTEGNPIALKVWKSSNNKEYLAELEVIKGTSTFMKHESTMVRLKNLGVTGLAEDPQSQVPKVDIYPNPADGKVYVHVNSSSFDGLHIRVSNAPGQLMLEQVMHSNPETIDLAGKAPGMYHIQILGDSWSISEKIVLR